ncbi:MAG: hypothetical protein A3K19_02445 [Lentisphaerae bacterium RIFOXYB12_FULL_65_16]|nr:MAG: hypothetical protein A3K18_27040 [Lentisphaerae bacterium RIFOXYA12_64_32]OGV85123.1 MAG: hypothetical protein A3K19_02445 [Lentisphaerae bacterium RIFOXYB12_FULL_65_16]
MPRRPVKARRNGKATLQTIADAAGVSMMTVSNALRGKTGDLSPETRERVLAIAGKLKYRPNLLVHGLRTGLSQNIGVMVGIQNPFGAGLVCGIHDGLAEQGWLSTLHWPGAPSNGSGAMEPQKRELAAVHALLDRRVDGIILLPWHESVADVYFREVWERGIPMVTIDRPLPKTRADFAGTDDTAGARLAAEHLLALGHRRFAVLAGPASIGTYAERTRVFHDTVKAVKARCRVVVADGRECDADSACARILASGATAVFLVGGGFAGAFYRSAAARGVVIGKDVSVVTMGSPDLVADLCPAVTFICQDPVRIGREAARLLLDRIAGKTSRPDPVYVRLTPEFVDRESTGRAPSPS